MEKELMEKYKGKKIRITLANGYFYVGNIEEFKNETLLFRDKFNNLVAIACNSITSVSPEKESGKQ